MDDLRAGRRREGGSTLTMQLARGFFLTPEKLVKRKIIEIAITFQLENRFNKQQIFQIYANQIPLGQQGSFAINGFGQAAQTYFGKDVRQLNLAECALLAGMIQHPSYLNPYRHPDRAAQRRNMVLDGMIELASAIVPSPNQSQNLPGMGIQRHECHLGIDNRRVIARLNPPGMLSLHQHVDRLHAFRHRLGGLSLQIRIERGIDSQALMIKVRIPQVLHQPVAHQVDEIRRLTGIDVHRGQRKRLGLGFHRLLLGDLARFHHRIQNHVAPLNSPVGMAIGV